MWDSSFSWKKNENVELTNFKQERFFFSFPVFEVQLLSIPWYLFIFFSILCFAKEQMQHQKQPLWQQYLLLLCFLSFLSLFLSWAYFFPSLRFVVFSVMLPFSFQTITVFTKSLVFSVIWKLASEHRACVVSLL